METKNTEEIELTQEQMIQSAIQHTLEAGLLFKAAGFDQTANNIFNFTTEAFNTLRTSTTNVELDKSKLDDETYDSILANIFGGE